MQIPHYQNLKSAVYKFKKRYSQSKVFSLGRSVADRKIFALGFGSLRFSRLFVGATHGSEWLTASALLRFAEEIGERAEKDEGFANSLDKNGIIIVPCLNPDGCEIAILGEKGAYPREEFIKRISQGDYKHYNANLNGVDLNHNFNAGFFKLKKLEEANGIFSPAKTRYGGLYPQSEPETHALCTLCNLFDPKVALTLHSQGEEIFYEYENYTPPQSKKIAEKLAQVSGYKLSHQTGLASHGGFKDWFIKEKRRPAFTIEMGKGENPLPVNDFEKIYQKLNPILNEMLKVDII